MQPLYVSQFQKDRQEELVGAADAWRRSHRRGRNSLRRRAGARLMAIGARLAGARLAGATFADTRARRSQRWKETSPLERGAHPPMKRPPPSEPG